MPGAGTRPVVVGTDGSNGALDAVAWAAREAALQGVPLRIVHAFSWPLLRVPTGIWQLGPEEGLTGHAKELLAEAERAALEAAPGIDVGTAMATAFVMPMLVEESRRAAYVVVGSSGLGAVADTLAGSTAVALVARSHAPVVVVRGTPPPEQPEHLVVVGIDGSPLGAAALELATAEAARRKGRLLAVHIGRRGATAGLRRLLARTPAKLTLLDRALAGWRRRYPDTPIEERMLSGHPGGALVDLSRHAALVVVGARGRGGFAGLLLGSVSQALVHHAQCPVIVIPPAVALAPESGTEASAETGAETSAERGAESGATDGA